MELKDILDRLRAGHTKRRIHRETKVHRTIIRQVEVLARDNGWLDPPQECPPVADPTEGELQAAWSGKKDEELSAHPLDQWRELIQGWVEKKHSFLVIHKLVQDFYQCSESTVRRFIQGRLAPRIKPIMVRGTIPGEIMEVDFGFLGQVLDVDRGIRRKAWVFSGRLRHSRKAWREVVFDQTQETFFRCHEHAFEYFGGVPAEVVPDNLKAAVIKASWEAPVYNRAFRSLARHYQFLISPCLPETPEHKGGVERDIQYIKRNFWPLFGERQRQRGREIPWREDLQPALEKWSDEVADTRKLYGFMKTPAALFVEEECEALRALPATRWDLEYWAQAQVGRDWRVRFDYSWYSVPWKLIGEKVMICASDTTIRVFHGDQQVAVHLRATERGQYLRDSAHAPPEKERYMGETRQTLLDKAEATGSATLEVAQSIFGVKEVDGMRPVRRLLGLANHHSPEELEAACKRALDFETPEYASVKNILKQELLHQPPAQPSNDPAQPCAIPKGGFRFARPLGFFLGKATSFLCFLGGIFHG